MKMSENNINGPVDLQYVDGFPSRSFMLASGTQYAETQIVLYLLPSMFFHVLCLANFNNILRFVVSKFNILKDGI